jgi:hypothetical protein
MRSAALTLLSHLDFYNRDHCSTLYSEKIGHSLWATPSATQLSPALHHLNLKSPLFH